MGKRGAKTTPTALNKLKGNPSRRPVNDSEPQPSDAGYAPPETISGDALPVWQRLAPELHALGLLTALDHDTLQVYCEAVASFVKATRRITDSDGDGDGELYITKNYATVSPWVNVQAKASAAMAKYGGRFGFSPSDRTGLVSTIQKETKAGDVTTQEALFGAQEQVQ